MPALWTCPKCRRRFRQVNQSHSCGVGRRSDLVKDRPRELVELYLKLERAMKQLKGVEIVAKGRCALFRTTRIFADLVIMKDALRVAVLLDHQSRDPIFFKAGHMSARRVAHVTKVRSGPELRAVLPYLREAYRFALRE